MSGSTVAGVRDRKQIEESILALESQRAVLGDAVVDTAVVSLRQKLGQANDNSLPQRKQATVLFAALVGFIGLSEVMDAEEMTELVNSLWARLDQAVVGHGGIIDKHLGGGLMALFGARMAKEDDPERAVLAGLVMQAELGGWMEEHTGKVPQALLTDIFMRIGINTGPVLLGTVGSKDEFTAMGDTVNMASRLEGAAPAGGVLIGETTWRQVAGRFECKPLSIRVKGREGPQAVYVVEGEKSAGQRSSGRGVAGIETRLVGREAELGQLCADYGYVMEEGRARVVTVLGEAGIGKSRLLQEFSVWLGNQPRTPGAGAGKVLTARASAESEYHPYSLVREWITSEFQITNSTPDGLARERLVAGMGAVSGGDPAMAEFIGHLIGLDFSSSPHIQNIVDDAEQIRGRAFYYLARFLRAHCQEQPIIMLLEDIHWADSGSLDAIEYLAQECGDVPLLIVGMARPMLLERRSEWGRDRPGATTLALKPLPAEASEGLVREILRHVQQIPEQLVRTITQAAEGNAFYIEELVKVLIDDGVIVQGEAEWHIREGGLGELRIPPTLTAVLQARMDRLPQAERTLLQRASVVGKTFWDSALDNLEDGVVDIQNQERLLANLVRHECIEPGRTSTFEGAVEYHFRHAILHEVVYESVLLRHRRLHHQRVAEWLIQVVEGQIPASVALIGEHFAQAGRSREAAAWFARAATQARETYLPVIAIDYYKKAIALYRETGGAESEVQCQPLYYYLGVMYVRQTQPDEAIDVLLMASRLAEEHGSDVERSRVWIELGIAYRQKGQLEESIEFAERAIAYARKAGVIQELVRAFAAKARVLRVLGHLDEAQALCHEALILCQGEGLEREISLLHLTLGTLHLQLGEHAQMLECSRIALDIFRSLDDRTYMCAALNNMGVAFRMQGKYNQAESTLREALQLSTESGDRKQQMLQSLNLAELRIVLGRFEEAVDVLHQAVVLTQGRETFFYPVVYKRLAQALFGLGRTDEAQESLDNALRVALSINSLRVLGDVWQIQGMITAQRQYSQSETDTSADFHHLLTPDACFAKSAELLTKADEMRELALTWREWAIFQFRTEGLEAAMPNWRRARAHFEETGNDFELRRTDDLLAEWLQHQACEIAQGG